MSNSLQYLNQFAKYFSVEGAKFCIDEDLSVLCIHNDQKVKGIVNVIELFANISNPQLISSDPIESALIYQWIEHFFLHFMPIDNAHEKANELNELFSSRTFLVNDRKTVADILLYFVVFHLMDSFTYLEKEKYVHFSRWFDNMQQEAQLRPKNKTINFSTNYLAARVPAKH